MKIKLVLTMCALLCTSIFYSQTEIDEIVYEGIALHDAGEYGKAIEVYKEALALDPNSSLVNYEMSLTYMNLKEYQKVIKHSDKVIKSGSSTAIQAYTNKGSALDYLGSYKKAIKTFKKGIDKYPENYNLRFNLGITYYGGGELSNAFDEFETSANLNPQHASSHFYLGVVAYDMGRTSQSLLAHYIFLFLEPTGNRADVVWDLFDSGINKVQDPESGKSINITLNDFGDDYEFMISDMMVSLIALDITSDSLEIDGVMTKLDPVEKSPFEKFSSRSQSFFDTVCPMKEDNDSQEIWWGLYVYLIDKINTSEYTDIYFRMITQGKYEESQEWISQHENEVDYFLNWLSGEE